VRNDVPAALPLIFLIAGLAAGSLLINPWIAIVGLIAITFRCKHALFAALGILLALHVQHRAANEQRAFASFDPERFVTIDAPLDRDWSERDQSHVLRAPRFVANGIAFDTPIAIYARFAPRNITMEATLHAEGFLRRNEQGEYTLGIKSPELMSYRGTLRVWQPRAWNRMLANALESHATVYPDEVALAQALLLGRGERLTKSMKESFRGGGTYHLLVFSGLQIAFAAGLLAALLRWMHAPRASDWLLMAFAILAPLFIGPSASVSRASTGIALYALSRICKRPTSLENLWCVAALLRLIVEPRDLTEASFHLTYAGAGALLFIGRHLGKHRWLGLMLGAEIAIAPLTLFHFHQYALGGAPLTFVMSPLIFAMLVLSALACLAPPLFLGIRWLHRLCSMLNALGFSGFFASPPVTALIAGAALALLAIALLRGRTRALAVAIALLIPSGAAIVRSLSQRSTPHPRVTFFDVGQGDAIALRDGAHTILVDGGRDERILPLLADRGIRRIDVVILSHAHPDHCVGLVPVVAHFNVGALWISPRKFTGDCANTLLEAARTTRTPIHFVRDGDTLNVSGLHLTAHLAEATFRRAPENNASIVLRVEAGHRTFLLTGDIEKEAELYLADHDLRADVLKVAHHGSRTSTSRALLDNVAPRLAVISCGRHNLFGHPHPAVVELLRERGVRTWRTDRDGTIDVEVTERRLYVRGGLD
jgi:competence protein ComEC